MTTLAALAQIVATVSVFWGPGLLVLRLAGCRGWLRTIAAAPAATLAVFFAGSLAASHLHVRWELWSALGCTAAVAAAAFLVRRRLSTDPVPVRRRVRAVVASSRWLAATIAAAVVAQLVPVWRPILRREQVANLTDTLFHFNALEYVRITGAADPVTFGHLIDPTGGTAFYPSAWHSVAALVPVVLDNTSVLAASTFVVVALAWTCGLAALAREVVSTGRTSVAVLAVALGAFGSASPLEPALSLGIIPDAVGLALVPGAAALVIGTFREPARGTRLRAGLVTLVLAIGLGACHPSAVAGAALVLAPWMATESVRWWARSGRAARTVGIALGAVVAGLAVYGTATSTVLAAVRSHRSESAVRFVDALVGLALGSTAQAVTIGVVVPALAFLAWALRLRRRQDVRPMVSWALAGVVYVLAAMNVPWGTPVTGFFYVEARRVVPLLSMWAVVLGAEGLARATRWVLDRTEMPASVSPRVVGALSCAVVVVLASWQPPAALAGSAAEVYTTTVDHPLSADEIVPFFTADELAMVNRLPAELPAGAVLFGSPRSGASYVYGLTGVKAFPFAVNVPGDLAYATANIERMGADAAVCAAFRAHGVTHLYTDPDLWKARGWEPLADPFAALPLGDVRLVDQGGYAKVYVIAGCG